MKKVTFTIYTTDGNSDRDGWLINNWFACHKEYRDWRLTHLPTGMAAFYGNLRRRSDAVRLAEFLTERADWSFTDADQIDDSHKEAMRRAIQEIDFNESYNRYEWREKYYDDP